MLHSATQHTHTHVPPMTKEIMSTHTTHTPATTYRRRLGKDSDAKIKNNGPGPISKKKINPMMAGKHTDDSAGCPKSADKKAMPITVKLPPMPNKPTNIKRFRPTRLIKKNEEHTDAKFQHPMHKNVMVK